MEQVKQFIEKAKSNSRLMAKLDALGAENADAEEVIALAAEYEFTFNKEEYEQEKSAESALQMGELSEEDLDAVSGGRTVNRWHEQKCQEDNPWQNWGGTLVWSACQNGNQTGFEKLFGINVPCDHYRKERFYGEGYSHGEWYTHRCVKGVFNYIGRSDGCP